MPKREKDDVERMRFRSMLATFGSVIVDHRLLLQLGLVLVASVAFLSWGPDGVRDGLNTVIGSAPVRQVSRASSAIWDVILDALRRADRPAVRAAVTPVVEDGAALSKEPALTTSNSAPAGAANSPRAMTGPPRPGVNDPLQAVRTSGSPANVGGAAADTRDADPPDAILWTLQKDGETLRAEMHDRGKPGVDLLLFRNGKLWRSERWADRAASRTEAQAKRASFEKLGWALKPA
jgi:hypothetical protein